MTVAVLKWPLKITDTQIIEMPRGSKALSVQIQEVPSGLGKKLVPTLWTECDLDSKNTPVKIQVVGTGRPFNNHGLEYIDTVQIGEFVWHLYWTKP